MPWPLPGAPGKPAEVRIYDGNGDRLLATVTPFPGLRRQRQRGDGRRRRRRRARPGRRRRQGPRAGGRRVYSGRRGRQARLRHRARPLPGLRCRRARRRQRRRRADRRHDRRQHHRRLGPRHRRARSRSSSTQLPASPAPRRRSSRAFKPYGDDRSGVRLATGFVDFATGRDSIVTAPGPGSPAEVKVFVFPLLKPDRRRPHQARRHVEQPVNTASFMPFGDDYRGGVSLATGWLAGIAGRRQAHRRRPARRTRRRSRSSRAARRWTAARRCTCTARMQHGHGAPSARSPASRPSTGQPAPRRHHQHDDRRPPAGQRRRVRRR